MPSEHVPFEHDDLAPVPASHNRAVLSDDAVTTRVPSGEKAADPTTRSCPLNTAITAPLPASHKRAVLSHDEVTTSLPSGKRRRVTPLA